MIECFQKYYKKEAIEEANNLIYPIPLSGFMEHLLKIGNKISDAHLGRLTFPEDALEIIKNSSIPWEKFSEEILLPFNIMSTQSF